MINKITLLILLATSSLLGQINDQYYWTPKPAAHNFSTLEVWRVNLINEKDSFSYPTNGCYDFEDSVLCETHIYNANGLPSRSFGYIGYHCSYTMLHYEYDAQQRLIKQVSLNKDSIANKQLSWSFNDSLNSCVLLTNNWRGEYEFFTSGYAKSRSYFTIDGELKNWAETILMDPQGNVQVEAMYNADSSFHAYGITKRMENKQVLEKSFLNKDSVLSYGFLYSYNSNGDIIKETKVKRDEGEQLEFVIKSYEYDSKGNLTVEIEYAHNEVESRTENIYDGQLIVQSNSYRNDKIISTTYFQKGLKSEVITYYEERPFAKYLYRYN